MSNSRNALLKGVLIVLLGPVGVGKSSVSNILIRIFRYRGFRAHKSFIKAFHGPSYLLWRSIVSLLGLPKDYAPWYVIRMSGYSSLAKALIIVSAYIDSLLCLPLKIILTRFLEFFRYIVISEEYLHTTLFDYLYSYWNLKIEPRLYAMLPLHMIYSLALRYRPDIVIVLNAELSTLLERWRHRGYGDPQLRYVIVQQRFLQRLYIYANIVTIDTSNMSLAETIMAVIEALKRLHLKVLRYDRRKCKTSRSKRFC